MFNLVPFDKRNHGLSAGDNRSTEMDSFFDSFFRDAFAPAFIAGSRQMKVDIRENDDGYILEADLPGVRKDQVNLEINDDQLVITVVEDEKSETKKEGYICRERRVGTIARSFPLPTSKPMQSQQHWRTESCLLRFPKRFTDFRRAVKLISHK